MSPLHDSPLREPRFRRLWAMPQSIRQNYDKPVMGFDPVHGIATHPLALNRHRKPRNVKQALLSSLGADAGKHGRAPGIGINVTDVGQPPDCPQTSAWSAAS